MACGEGRSDFMWSTKRNATGTAPMPMNGSGVGGGSSNGTGTGTGGCTGVGWGLEFYDCVLNNDLQRLESLVDRHRIDLDAKFTAVRKKNHLDLSPIHLVAYKGYAGMLQYLYDMKCDIHLQTATLRRTAFHFAVLRHKAACFHKLLSFGAKPDARDTFGNTACHYASEDGDVLLLDVLLRHRTVDPNAQDIAGKTPLMKAARNGKLEAVKRLLAAGCSLTVRDRNGDSALHFAARHGNERIVAALVAAGNGPDIINMQNVWGYTALLEAVCYSNKDAVGRLLEAGCDVTFREVRSGESALHVAVRKNYSVITQQLLAFGAGLGPVYNYQGERAVFDVIINQKLDSLRLFMRYNYDFDAPCKFDYDGSGGRVPIRVALERDLADVLRIFAAVGYAFNVSVPAPLGGSVLSAVAGVLAGVDGAGSASSKTGFGGSTPRLVGVTKELASTVRSLKSQCRRDIRRLIGFGIEVKTGTLPLPVTLRDFILLKDILID